MRLKSLILYLIVIAKTSTVLGQLDAQLIGDAIANGDNCFTITPDLGTRAGGVWYNNPIDFDVDFTIFYQNNFGSKDANGADGMALVFKRNPTPEIGNVGGGLGYSGISSSLIVEFDTYQNTTIGDPVIDHIAIMKNGNENHNSVLDNLSGPIQASSTNSNIEDGNVHEVKIEWDATAMTLSVYFDCELRLTLNRDIKNNIFSGDDTVFFGFVGSTGGLSNLHQVCFNRVSFVDNLILEDSSICIGESIELDAAIPSGIQYRWEPTNGVSNPNIPNPVLSPSTTTTYTVIVSDICNDIVNETVTISVLPTDVIFTQVDPICSGDTLSPLPTTSNNGITGSWTPGINNLVTTLYTFTPDDNQCAVPTTMRIVVNPTQVPLFDEVGEICEGDIIDPLPTTSNDGITGSWSPTFNNSQTTVYTFVADDNPCVTATQQIVVNIIQTPLFNIIDEACEGDIINPLPITSINGITGTWAPGINNLETTLYTFTPNGDQCADVETHEIVVNPLQTPLFNIINEVCEGDNINPLPTTSTNGITGTWSPGINNLETTEYTFTPDPDQCATTEMLQIVVNPILKPLFDNIDEICEGDIIDPLPTTSNDGIIGSWLPVINNLETTTYTFTAQDNPCATTTLQIVVNPIQTPLFNIIGEVCEGDIINPLPTTSINGITGTWSPGVNNLETTQYTFTPNPDQCAAIETREIVVNPIQTPLFNIIDEVCEGEIINPLPTTSTNGITGNWSPGVNNLETTQYTFIPDPDQCAAIETYEIVVIPLQIPLFDDVDNICEGDPIDPLPTTSNNGITGTWSPEINNSETTVYTFTAEDVPCSTTTLEIVVNPKIIPIFDVVKDICEGEIIDPLPVVSDDGITGTWSPEINNLETTVYIFTPDENQCAEAVSLQIQVIPFSELSIEVEVLSEPFSIDQIAEVTVTGGNGNYEFQLDNESWVEDNIFSRISGCFDHSIKAREISGCSNVVTATFQILEYPRFFTPNGDTFNDMWNIDCLKDQPNARIKIFNRYGKLLADISPAYIGWDGNYNNLGQPTDSYWFKVEYFDKKEAVQKTFSSYFTLKR